MADIIEQISGQLPNFTACGRKMRAYAIPDSDVLFLEFLALQVPKYVIYRNRCGTIVIEFKDCCPKFPDSAPPGKFPKRLSGCDCDDFHRQRCGRHGCDCDYHHDRNCRDKCIYPYYSFRNSFQEYLTSRGATLNFALCEAVDLIASSCGCDHKDALWIRATKGKIYYYFHDKKDTPCAFQNILCKLPCKPEKRENRKGETIYRVVYELVRNIHCNDDQSIHPV